MRQRLVILGILALGGLSCPAVAESIPDSALDKDYENCMGGQQDANRATYCACIRDEIKKWDIDTYGSVAMAQSKSGSTTESASPKIDEIAKTCIARALK